MGILWQDARYAMRVLARSPGFTAIAVFTMAVGIGATAAMFSIVNGVLLRPTPFKDATRPLMVWEIERGGRPDPRAQDVPLGVQPLDAATLTTVPVFLRGTFILASHLPARRAARIDPMAALRCE